MLHDLLMFRCKIQIENKVILGKGLNKLKLNKGLAWNES
jgi:hypothetical protein